MNTELAKEIEELSKNKPKLGVYSTMDGSLYSKPSEVRALIQWIKQMSDLKQKIK